MEIFCAVLCLWLASATANGIHGKNQRETDIILGCGYPLVIVRYDNSLRLPYKANEEKLAAQIEGEKSALKAAGAAAGISLVSVAENGDAKILFSESIPFGKYSKTNFKGGNFYLEGNAEISKGGDIFVLNTKGVRADLPGPIYSEKYELNTRFFVKEKQPFYIVGRSWTYYLDCEQIGQIDGAYMVSETRSLFVWALYHAAD